MRWREESPEDVPGGLESSPSAVGGAGRRAVHTAAVTSFSLCAMLCASCTFGPQSLKADQVNYARALGDANKREIVSMIVGLRYADAPSVLNLTQIIAAYTLDATGTTVVNSRPDPGGPLAGATGVLSYSNHPTFTFTPTTGDRYAKAYIQPLAPALILPLADSGIPIDLLLRITVQSIGRLSNATMLGGASGNGSPGFFELLNILRRLQLAGELSIRYVENSNPQRVIMAVGSPYSGSGAAPSAVGTDDDLKRLRVLLGLTGKRTEYEIVVGFADANSGKIPVVTRSVLAILTDLGAEIDVPAADVANGTTKPAIDLTGGETRPVMIIHVGKHAPSKSFTSIGYRSSQFWIDDSDFDSKYALTVVQDVMALAEVTDTSRTPILTIPTN